MRMMRGSADVYLSLQVIHLAWFCRTHVVFLSPTSSANTGIAHQLMAYISSTIQVTCFFSKAMLPHNFESCLLSLPLFKTMSATGTCVYTACNEHDTGAHKESIKSGQM